MNQDAGGDTQRTNYAGYQGYLGKEKLGDKSFVSTGAVGGLN
jgi:hypothetical protein